MQPTYTLKNIGKIDIERKIELKWIKKILIFKKRVSGRNSAVHWVIGIDGVKFEINYIK